MAICPCKEELMELPQREQSRNGQRARAICEVTQSQGRLLASRARLRLSPQGVSRSPWAVTMDTQVCISVPPAPWCPWGCDAEESLLHPLRQHICGDGGYPKTSNGNCLGMLALSQEGGQPALTAGWHGQPSAAVGRLLTANQTHAVLPSETTGGGPSHPYLGIPLSPGFHGAYLGGNYKDADDELIAIFISLDAEVTVFTLAIIIAMNTQ